MNKNRRLNVNAIEKAVALRYDNDSENAPKVVAKGKGILAKRIIELANKNNVPIREDSDLLELLSAVEINEEISPDLYKVIAEVLAMIYRVNGAL